MTTRVPGVRSPRYVVGNVTIEKECWLAPDETGAETLLAGMFTATGRASARSFGFGPGDEYAEEHEAFWAAVEWSQSVGQEQATPAGVGFTRVAL